MTANKRPRQRKAEDALASLMYLESRLENEYADGEFPLTDIDRNVMLAIVKDIVADRDPRDRYFRGKRGRQWLDTPAKQFAAVAIGMNSSAGQPPSDELIDEIARLCHLSDDQVRHIYRRIRKNRSNPPTPMLANALRRLESQGDK